MTKRALVVIAILILIPIIIVAVGISKFKSRNTVVAEYGGSIDIIEYGDLTLHRVRGEEEYNFRFGEFLGKVGDRLTGASLYLVKDDENCDYYAIADGTKRILYTESGELTDGIRGENSVVTRVVFDDYLIEETDAEDIALITGIEGKKVSVDMTENQSYKYYDLYLSFDGSAILTEYYGRLILLTERDRWIYISPEELEIAKEEYGDEIGESVYVAELITDKELGKLLESYFTDKPADTSSESEA